MNDKMDYRGIFRVIRRNFGYMNGRRALYLTGGIMALGSLAVSFLIPYLYEQLMILIQAGATYSDILRAVGPAFIALVLTMPLVCVGSYWQKSSANFATANMQRTVFSTPCECRYPRWRQIAPTRLCAQRPTCAVRRHCSPATQ